MKLEVAAYAQARVLTEDRYGPIDAETSSRVVLDIDNVENDWRDEQLAMGFTVTLLYSEAKFLRDCLTQALEKIDKEVSEIVKERS